MVCGYILDFFFSLHFVDNQNLGHAKRQNHKINIILKSAITSLIKFCQNRNIPKKCVVAIFPKVCELSLKITTHKSAKN